MPASSVFEMCDPLFFFACLLYRASSSHIPPPPSCFHGDSLSRTDLHLHSTREITTCRSSSLHHQQGIDLNLSCSSQHRRNIEVLLSVVHHNSLPFCCATEAKIILYRIRRDKYLLQETNPIAQRCYLNLSYILLYLLLHVSCCALQKFFCR